jgi:molybdopterin-containing oxidoreductase family iron-sulfur binding subunit
MEKCTYCVQRINETRIEAKKAVRPIADGEVITACQQACPTQAIIFGDLNDKSSLVYKVKQEAQNYALLDELGVRPRTTHMAKFWNPNPALRTSGGAEAAAGKIASEAQEGA